MKLGRFIPYNIWLDGCTGVGKSSVAAYVAANYGNRSVWRSSKDLNWFNGYIG